MLTKPFVRALVLVAATALGSGCTEGLRGVPLKPPAATGKIVASVTSSEPNGLLVLWDGASRARRKSRVEWMAWVAGNDEEFEDVWENAAPGKPPRIDFASYVVFARVYEGSGCQPKIIGIDAEASGLLLARFPPQTIAACVDILVPIARIVAVPRRILPATVVFFDGYAFEVPDVPFG